jgi:uncharacterized membrane protein
MSTREENEIKKEFQLERIIFFSDAVFAIIITIMVLDVKLPDVVKYSTETEAKSAFFQVLPKLSAFIVTFFMVGNFWMRHLRIFSYLKDYNAPLVFINLLFLLSVSLYPFALSFIFNGGRLMKYTWVVYTYISIINFTTFTETLLTGYLLRNKELLCVRDPEMENVLRWKIVRINYFAVPAIFVLLYCTVEFEFDTRIFFGLLIGYSVLIRVLIFVYYRHHKRDRVTLASLFRRIKVADHPAKPKRINKK